MAGSGAAPPRRPGAARRARSAGHRNAADLRRGTLRGPRAADRSGHPEDHPVGHPGDHRARCPRGRPARHARCPCGHGRRARSARYLRPDRRAGRVHQRHCAARRRAGDRTARHGSPRHAAEPRDPARIHGPPDRSLSSRPGTTHARHDPVDDRRDRRGNHRDRPGRRARRGRHRRDGPRDTRRAPPRLPGTRPDHSTGSGRPGACAARPHHAHRDRLAPPNPQGDTHHGHARSRGRGGTRHAPPIRERDGTPRARPSLRGRVERHRARRWSARSDRRGRRAHHVARRRHRRGSGRRGTPAHPDVVPGRSAGRPAHRSRYEERTPAARRGHPEILHREIQHHGTRHHGTRHRGTRHARRPRSVGDLGRRPPRRRVRHRGDHARRRPAARLRDSGLVRTGRRGGPPNDRGTADSAARNRNHPRFRNPTRIRCPWHARTCRTREWTQRCPCDQSMRPVGGYRRPSGCVTAGRRPHRGRDCVRRSALRLPTVAHHRGRRPPDDHSRPPNAIRARRCSYPGAPRPSPPTIVSSAHPCSRTGPTPIGATLEDARVRPDAHRTPTHADSPVASGARRAAARRSSRRDDTFRLCRVRRTQAKTVISVRRAPSWSWPDAASPAAECF